MDDLFWAFRAVLVPKAAAEARRRPLRFRQWIMLVCVSGLMIAWTAIAGGFMFRVVGSGGVIALLVLVITLAIIIYYLRLLILFAFFTPTL